MNKPTSLRLKIKALFIISLCVITLLFTGFSVLSHQAVVVFDVKQTLNQFQQTLIEKGVETSLQTDYLIQFATTLEATTTAYSEKNNVIILTTPAVVSGATDVTRELQQQIIAQYQRGSNAASQGVVNPPKRSQ
jgi:conjugal transfer pilin signal peptidase TrbI